MQQTRSEADKIWGSHIQINVKLTLISRLILEFLMKIKRKIGNKNKVGLQFYFGIEAREKICKVREKCNVRIGNIKTHSDPKDKMMRSFFNVEFLGDNTNIDEDFSSADIR